jgi:large subunit ribosomal protein L22
MIVKARAKYIRISPRKLRLVADAVRGLDLTIALNKLAIVKKRAEQPVTKLLKSALASAEHNYELEKNNLYIKEIRVDDGPIYYRWMPHAHGRATQIRHRTSTLAVVLDEKVPSKKKAKKEKKIETVKVKEKMGTAGVEEAVGEKAEKGKTEPPTKETVDPRRVSGYRDVHQKQVKTEKPKGFFKKMFRRMSGE